MDEILNSEQVAAMLGCSTRTVEDHARDGRLSATKFGDGWVFVRSLLIEDVRRISIAQAEKRRDEIQKSRDKAKGVVVVEPKELVGSKSRRKPPADLSAYAHLVQSAA